jgi:phage recombination protein Bet
MRTLYTRAVSEVGAIVLAQEDMTMTTNITTTKLEAALPYLAKYNDAQLTLIRSICPAGAGEIDFAMFMCTADRIGLDPFANQIWLASRWDTRSQRETFYPLVKIDGFRSIADRTGECDGQDGPYWCGNDGVWKDVWLHDNAPTAAKVIVYRKGQTHGYVGIATLSSYAPLDKEGKPDPVWARLPDVMLAKVAESIALRKAFPMQLGGVYTPEEMRQAGSTPKPPRKQEDVEVELDAVELNKLFGKIAAAKRYYELRKLLPTLRKLVMKQKRAAQMAWRAKLASEGWKDPKVDPKPEPTIEMAAGN